MALFRYVGDPHEDGSDPDVITAYGYTFTKGEACRVTDKRAISKLSANSHFEEVKAKDQAKAAASAEASESAETATDEPKPKRGRGRPRKDAAA